VNASGKAKLSPLTKTVVRARSDRDMEDSLMSKNKRSLATFAMPADYGIEPEDSPTPKRCP
jgi:hypothetical protein